MPRTAFVSHWDVMPVAHEPSVYVRAWRSRDHTGASNSGQNFDQFPRNKNVFFVRFACGGVCDLSAACSLLSSTVSFAQSSLFLGLSLVLMPTI